jgi:SAM-dependent methyltransferase
LRELELSGGSAGVRQPCLLCRSQDYRRVKQFADGVVVGECRVCQLLYTPVRHPEPESLLFGADSDTLRVLNRPIVAGTHRHYRARNFEQYLKIIEPKTGGRRLLDVGCAQGFFLATARQRGFEVMGIEPSRPMADFAMRELKLDVVHGRLDQVDLGDRQWDVITFTDSLEYFAEPLRDIGKAVRHLAPRGLLFAKVPNGEYFRLRHSFERLFGRPGLADEAFSPSRRVAHYSTRTLGDLVSRVGGLEVLALGEALPIDSPTWKRSTGLDLEVEPTWRSAGIIGRLVRRLLYAGAHAEMALTRRTRLSPSLYVLAGRR